ncbi:unnamed protein product [Prunus armeniaca]
MQTVDLPMSTCNQLDKLNMNFLWGFTGDKTKIHLVNWDTVCQPKSFGGLGIKKIHCMNQALLAKTGWKIVQKDQGLWSQVLNGLKWRVGNGDNILFWKDNWAGCGPLENFFTISLSDDLLEWTVSDFLTEQGWNTNWLLGCLPLDVVQKIHCIHVGLVSAACKVSLGPLYSWAPCGFVGNGDVRKCLMSTLLLLIGPTFQSFNLLGNGWWLTAPRILRLPTNS